MLRTFFYVILSNIVVVTGCSTYKYNYGSSYDSSFNKSEIKKITIVYSEFDASDENFWSHKTMKNIDTTEVYNNILNDLNTRFSDENVILINKSDEIPYDLKNAITEEAGSIKQFRRDLQIMENLNFSFNTNVDYSSLTSDSDSKYALYFKIYPNQYTETVMISNSFGGYSNSSSTHYRVNLFTYLVDVENGKVIWVFDNSEHVDLYKFEFNSISRVIVDALMKGTDTKFLTYPTPLR